MVAPLLCISFIDFARGINSRQDLETRSYTEESFGVGGFLTFRERVVTVLISNKMPARRVQLEVSIEAVGIETMVEDNITRFIAVYKPLKTTLSEKDIKSLTKCPRTLIGGDWNSKDPIWSSRRANSCFCFHEKSGGNTLLVVGDPAARSFRPISRDRSRKKVDS